MGHYDEQIREQIEKVRHSLKNVYGPEDLCELLHELNEIDKRAKDAGYYYGEGFESDINTQTGKIRKKILSLTDEDVSEIEEELQDINEAVEEANQHRGDA